jgi:Flp pilus assembly protein TadD
VAALQVSLGWFEAQRGNLAAAHHAVDAAMRLTPSDAYAVVLKGVLLARERKFEEAVEMWKKARSIEPSFPNIDALIAEAERLRRQ